MSNRLVAGVIASFLILGTVGCSSDSDGGSTGSTGSTEQTTNPGGDTSSTPGTDEATSTPTTDGTGPASADAVASSLQSVFGITRTQALCAAEKLQDQVSEKTFRAIANANPDEVPDDEPIEDLAKILGEAFTSCA